MFLHLVKLHWCVEVLQNMGNAQVHSTRHMHRQIVDPTLLVSPLSSFEMIVEGLAELGVPLHHTVTRYDKQREVNKV